MVHHWRATGTLLIALAAAPPLAAQGQERTAVGQPSIADSTLTRDVWGMMSMLAGAGPAPEGCKDEPTLGERVIAESPKNGDARKNKWVEKWTVTRCEANEHYLVTFTPGRRGTQFSLAPIVGP